MHITYRSLRSSQSGRICNGPAHHTGHNGNTVLTEQVKNDCNNYTNTHNGQGQQIIGHGVLLQRSPETGSYLQPNGINKQNQSKLFYKVFGGWINPHTRIGKNQPGKKYPGDAK